MLIDCSELARADTLSMSTPTENVSTEKCDNLYLCAVRDNVDQFNWSGPKMTSQRIRFASSKKHIFYRGRQFYLRNNQLQTWLKNTG